MLAARRRDQLDRVAAAIVAAGGAATAVRLRRDRPGAGRHGRREALAATGRLDVMVCNAGLGYNGRLDETDAETMRQLMEVNYFGTFHAARAAVRHFRGAGRGHLFIMSSIVGRKGVPRMGAYAATKFAQVGLGESVRAELAGTGIHVHDGLSDQHRDRSSAARWCASGAWMSQAAVRGSRPSRSPRPWSGLAPAARRHLSVARCRASSPAASALLPGLADWVSTRFTRKPKQDR